MVKRSSSGSDFIALRIATEKLEALRYKLRMMGTPIEGPANMFCDNEYVIRSSYIPESTMKKKHKSICYHKVRELQASGSICVPWEDGQTNLTDLLTKIQSYAPQPSIPLLTVMDIQSQRRRSW
jgi:hypothetical protein